MKYSIDFQPDSQLHKIAKTLLGTDFSVFERFIDDWRTLDLDLFESKYANTLQDFDANNIFNDSHQSQCKEDWRDENEFVSGSELIVYFLIGFAESKGRLKNVDWSGQGNPGELMANVNELLLRLWDKKLEWKSDDDEESEEYNGLARGEHVPYLMKEIDEQLQKTGFRLVTFDTGDDCYRYTVLSVKGTEQLPGKNVREGFRVDLNYPLKPVKQEGDLGVFEWFIVFIANAIVTPLVKFLEWYEKYRMKRRIKKYLKDNK